MLLILGISMNYWRVFVYVTNEAFKYWNVGRQLLKFEHVTQRSWNVKAINILKIIENWVRDSYKISFKLKSINSSLKSKSNRSSHKLFTLNTMSSRSSFQKESKFKLTRHILSIPFNRTLNLFSYIFSACSIWTRTNYCRT